jgi:hypothetical protein
MWINIRNDLIASINFCIFQITIKLSKQNDESLVYTRIRYTTGDLERYLLLSSTAGFEMPEFLLTLDPNRMAVSTTKTPAVIA